MSHNGHVSSTGKRLPRSCTSWSAPASTRASGGTTRWSRGSARPSSPRTSATSSRWTCYNLFQNFQQLFLICSGWAPRVLTVALWMWIFPPQAQVLISTHIQTSSLSNFCFFFFQKSEEHLVERRQLEVEGNPDLTPGNNTWEGLLPF